MKPSLLALLLLLAPGTGLAVSAPDADTLSVRQWRQQHEQAIVDEFASFLRIPDVSADSANIRRNASSSRR